MISRCVFNTACGRLRTTFDSLLIQVVNIQFEDGTTAGFTMVAFTKVSTSNDARCDGPAADCIALQAICERSTRIHGSHGELIGDMSTFTVTDFRTGDTRTYSPKLEGGGHGGGDSGLMRAFIKAVGTGNQMELGVTPQDILRSHLMVFAAEKARRVDQVVKFVDFQQELAGMIKA